MEVLGTNYGGWSIPINSKLNENSIIYSAGVGEDISFDLKLQCKYNSNIFLIDPTPRALKHFNEITNLYNNKTNIFTGNIQNDYLHIINDLKPNFSKFTYLNIGLHSEKKQLKFYKQDNPNYVSQSLIENMFGENYDIVDVDTIKNIMNKYNHKQIDLLKLDIEGSEIDVLNNMLDDEIYPKYLCIEFDLFLKKKDNNNLTNNIIERLLRKNYKIIDDKNLNITFEKV